MGQSGFPAVGAGTALVVGAFGIGGFYLGDAFPVPVGPVMKVLGVGAVGYSLYSLWKALTGNSASDVNSKASTPPSQQMSQAAFDQVDGFIKFPAAGTKPDVTSNWLGPDTFDIQVLWSNGSQENANFNYDILAYSVSGPGAVSEQLGTRISKIVYPSQIKDLPAGHQTTITIQIPLFQAPSQGTFVGMPNQKAPYFDMYLQLRKILSNQAVPVGSLVQFGPFDYKS
jgi:hypothetical protein